jgi:tRNA(Glu) U13 pseudouridine synthase TruD
MVRTDNAAVGVAAWEAAVAAKGETAVRRATATDASAESGLDPSAVVVPLLGTEVDLPAWATAEILAACAPGGDASIIELAQSPHRVNAYTLKGSYRHVWATPRRLEVDATTADGTLVLRFDLPPATFATELLAKLVARY